MNSSQSGDLTHTLSVSLRPTSPARSWTGDRSRGEPSPTKASSLSLSSMDTGLHISTSNVHDMEARLAVADERSVNVLNEKVSAMQMWRRESEKKDQLIMQLKEQIHQLQPGRDHIHQLKNRNLILEERLKLKEHEHKGLQNEFQQLRGQYRASEANLNTQIQQLEDTRSSATQMQKEKSADLRGQIQKLNAEAARREQIYRSTEKELAEMTQAAQWERKLSSEREQRQREVKAQLHQQLNVVQQHLNEQMEKNSAAELQKSKHEREIKEQTRVVEHLTKGLETAQQTIQELTNKLNTQHENHRNLNETIQGLRADLEAVPTMQRELASVPTLQQEVQKYQNQILDLEAACERSRNAARFEEEDKQRLKVANAELLLQINDLNNKLASMKDPAAELQEKTMEMKVIAKDLDTTRGALSRLKQELKQEVEHRKDDEQQYQKATQDVKAELLQLHTALEGALEGKDFLLQPFSDIMLNSGYFSGLKSVLVGLRSRLLEVCTQFSHIKEKNKHIQQNLDQQMVLVSTLEHDKNEAQTDCTQLSIKVEKLVTALRDSEDEAHRWSCEVKRLQQEEVALKATLSERTEIISYVAQRLIDNNSKLDTSTNEDDNQSTRTPSLPVFNTSANLETMRLMFDEYVDASYTTHDRLIRRSRSLKEINHALEDQVREMRLTYSNAVSKSRAELSELEQDKYNALEEQRQQLTTMHQMHVEKLQLMATSKEKELRDLQTQCTELKLELVQCRADVGTLGQEKSVQQENISLLQKSVENSLANLAAEKSNTEMVTKELEKAHASKQEMEEEFQKVHGQTAAIQEQLDTLGSEMKGIAAERDAAIQEKNQLQMALDKIQNECQVLQDEIAELGHSLGTKDSEIERLQNELSISNATMQSMSANAKGHAETLTRSEADVANANERCEKLWHALAILTRAWLGLNRQAHLLRGQKRQLSRHTQILYTSMNQTMGDMRMALTGATSDAPASFRVAVLAVIAANRLRRLCKSHAMGSHEISSHVHAVTGISRLDIADPDVIMSSGIPADFPKSEQSEAEALMHLLTHMCSADALLELSNIHTAHRSDFISRLPGRPPSILSKVKLASADLLQQVQTKAAENHALQSAYNQVHEEMGMLQRKLSDTESQCGAKLANMEEALAARLALTQFLEEKVQQMSKDKESLIAPERYNAVLQECQSLNSHLETLQRDKETTTRQRAELRQQLQHVQEVLQTHEDKAAMDARQLEQKVKELEIKSDDIERLNRDLASRTQEMEALRRKYDKEMDDLSAQSCRQIAEIQSLGDKLRSAVHEADEYKYQNVTTQHKIVEEESKLKRLERALKRKEDTILSNADMIKSLSTSHTRVTQELAKVQKELYEAQHAHHKDAVARQHWSKVRLNNLNRRVEAEEQLLRVASSPSRPQSTGPYAGSRATSRYPSPSGRVSHHYDISANVSGVNLDVSTSMVSSGGFDEDPHTSVEYMPSASTSRGLNFSSMSQRYPSHGEGYDKQGRPLDISAISGTQGLSQNISDLNMGPLYPGVDSIPPLMPPTIPFHAEVSTRGSSPYLRAEIRSSSPFQAEIRSSSPFTAEVTSTSPHHSTHGIHSSSYLRGGQSQSTIRQITGERIFDLPQSDPPPRHQPQRYPSNMPSSQASFSGSGTEGDMSLHRRLQHSSLAPSPIYRNETVSQADSYFGSPPK